MKRGFQARPFQGERGTQVLSGWRCQVGRVIGVEIAKTQIRAASMETSELRASRPGQTADFDRIAGLSRDLGEMIADRSLIASMHRLILEVAQDAADEVEGIGIGISAAVLEKVSIAHLTHQAGNVQQHFQEALKVLGAEFPNARQRTVLDNRTNLAAWGEYHLGWREILNPAATDLLFITVSSSVGGGIIADGRLLRGVKGLAGQIGHLVVDPTSSRKCLVCNQNGCAAVLASGRSLLEYVIEHQSKFTGLDVILGHVTEADGQSPTVDVGYRADVEVNGTRREVNARAVLLSVHDGAELATKAVDEMTTHLAKLIEELAYILDPNIVILGGIAAAYPELEGAVDEKVKLRAYAKDGHYLRTSLMGDQAALYGAALRVCPPLPQTEGQ